MDTTTNSFGVAAIALLVLLLSMGSAHAVIIDLTSPATELNGNQIANVGSRVTEAGPNEIDFVAAFMNEQSVMLDVLLEPGDSPTMLAFSTSLLNLSDTPWSAFSIELSDGAMFSELTRVMGASNISLLNGGRLAVLELNRPFNTGSSLTIGNPNSESDDLDWTVALDGFSTGDRFTVRLNAGRSASSNPIPEPGTVALLLMAFGLMVAQQSGSRMITRRTASSLVRRANKHFKRDSAMIFRYP